MRRGRGPALVAAASLAAALSLAGCELVPSLGADDRPPLMVENGLAGLDVVVAVNGAPFEVATGTSAMVTARELGSLPWTVEVRTPVRGRLLIQQTVPEGAATCVNGTDGSRSCSGVLDLVDLSCGRLVVYVTADPPSLPAPNPGAGEPGDCDP